MALWALAYDGYVPEQEGLREALCTLGNGYFCTRGAGFDAKADNTRYPGTYLAGGYNRLTTEIAGHVIENEDLVNIPNWLPLTFRLPGGPWFKLTEVKLLDYRQELNIRQGILRRNIRFEDDQGRITRLDEHRLVHMENCHLAGLSVTLIPENWSGTLSLRTALDGRVVNAGVKRYSDLENRHLVPLESRCEAEDILYLKVRTSQSRVEIAMAARTRVYENGAAAGSQRKCTAENGFAAQEFSAEAVEGKPLSIEKIITLYTSRDFAITECGMEALREISRIGRFAELMETHSLTWKHLWRRFNIRFEHTDPEEGDRTGMILHLHIFHLLQTTSVHTMDLDAGVPSRGWHGEAYRGHILWDELFIFPILNLRLPAITRSLLMYRFRRLDEARFLARKAGHAGAMYPWQSGSDGREESQNIHLNPASGRWIADNSQRQRHVNAAIAYNIYQFFQVTGDMEFLSFYGTEMFLEIARFWASISVYNEAEDRYEIKGVMGPDEYHDQYPHADQPGLNNNAYTNVMAVWVLMHALRILRELLTEDRAKEICETLRIGPDELDRWEVISRKMKIVFHDDGIISQFEGYGDLKEFDWEGYKQKYGNIQRLDRILEAENDSVNHYKISKQADVLMLFYLFSANELQTIFDRLGYTFDKKSIPKNIEYYINRTSHGSTLSWVVHAWVTARMDRKRSWQLFEEALHADLKDIQGGTTPEGIHLGAMAGTVDLIKEGYTGIQLHGEVLWFKPRLPGPLKRLGMQIRYRGHTLEMDIDRQTLTLTSLKAAERPIRVGYQDNVYDLEAEMTLTFRLKEG